MFLYFCDFLLVVVVVGVGSVKEGVKIGLQW